MKHPQRVACTAVLLWLLVAGVTHAASPTGLAALNSAGEALSGEAALLGNPAGAASIPSRTVFAALNLTPNEGLRGAFAYAEPNNGFASGILGWSEERRVTSIDALTDEPLLDRTGAVAYVVARPIGDSTDVGVRIRYERIESEEGAREGSGYRVDAGVIRRLGSGFSLGLSVDGLWGSGISWSDGARTAHARAVGAGVSWESGPVLATLDVVSEPGSTQWAVNAGAQVSFGVFRLAAGIGTSRLGETVWSAGGAYALGEFEFEYAYVGETGVHLVGTSWRF